MRPSESDQTLDEERPLDLAGRRSPRERLDHDDAPRVLERGEAPGAVLAQVFEARGPDARQRGRLGEHDHRAHDLAPIGIGEPDDRNLGDARLVSEHGFHVAKLFPAAAVGGIAMLKALHGPLPDFMFCPTGGINEADAGDYLAQPNVACIGGSWMVPRSWLQAGEFDKVAAAAARARALVDAAQR